MSGVVTKQKAFSELNTWGNLANAKSMSETTFFVGIHQTLSDEDIKYVAGNLSEL